jgi:hypothetical protein
MSHLVAFGRIERGARAWVWLGLIVGLARGDGVKVGFLSGQGGSWLCLEMRD